MPADHRPTTGPVTVAQWIQALARQQASKGGPRGPRPPDDGEPQQGPGGAPHGRRLTRFRWAQWKGQWNRFTPDGYEKLQIRGRPRPGRG